MWTFGGLQHATMAGTVTALGHDGRNIWAAAGTQVKIFGYWDANSDYEYLDINYSFTKHAMPLYEIQSLTAAGPVTDIRKWVDTVYLRIGTTIVPYTFNTSGDWVAGIAINLPEACHPNFYIANNKLWVATTGVDANDRNSLYAYDLLTSSWSAAIPLPGAKQSSQREFVDGLDGFLYVTQRNDHSLFKVNTVTNTVAQIIFTNRHPYKLDADQNKNVYIVSDAQTHYLEGMVQKMTSTGTVTEVSAAGGDMNSFAVDTTAGKMWYVGSNALLGRMDIATGDYRYLVDEPPDPENPVPPGGTILMDLWPDYEPNTSSFGILTPRFTYQRVVDNVWTSVTVKPYLVYAVGAKVVAIRTGAMLRVNILEVLGSGIVSSGPQNYIGD